MIRPAKFADTPRIVELMHDMHARSKYWDLVAVDESVAHKLVFQCIQRHGHVHDGGSLVMVSTVGDTVEGFMIGILDRLYHITNKLSANDVFLYCSEAAPKIDMIKLVDAYMTWAMNNPKVASIKASWTDAIQGSDRMASLYTRKGFNQIGMIYERLVVEPQTTALALLEEV